MAANIKKLFFFLLLLPIYLYSNNTYKNQDIVLKELIQNTDNSKSILSEQIGICLKLGNSHLIKLNNDKFLKSFKINDILNFLKYKYHHNFNNCLKNKDIQYIYNLSKLYHAQKQYHINAEDTLSSIENYFEPIEAIDARTEYKKSSNDLKEYLNHLVGDNPFNIFELSKDISNYHHTKIK